MHTFSFEQLYQNNGPQRQRANVKFFIEDVEDKEATLREGRPIFIARTNVSIQWPGQDETVRRATEEDKRNYPQEWAAFEAGQEDYDGPGTPLKEWSLIPSSIAKEFNALGFRTVEQVATANDSARTKLGPNWRYVKLAADWLAAAKTPQNEVTALRTELEKYKAAHAKQQEQIELLLQRIEANEGTRLTMDVEDISDTPKRRSKRSI